MSKKKNTLKDLDEFLKQQAATLVAPQSLSETIRTHAPVAPPPAPAPATAAPAHVPPTIPPTPEPIAATTAPAPAIAHIQEPVSADTILRDLNQLAQTGHSTFRKALYEVIIKAMETQIQSLPEDKMLINTALYLKSGDNWKEVIREYWKNR
jgi:hypothetical protein